MQKTSSRADWKRVTATTDAEIRRQAIEDGHPVMTAKMLKEAKLIVPPEAVDVQAIRRRQHLSQAAFAAKYGFSKRTLQEWEQGRARPDRATRLLLAMIEREPATVERVLRSVP
jgi:putative transcriptional regulator